MEVIKEELYRSTSYINKTDDMVRVTLTCTRNEWRELKNVINNLEWPRSGIPEE